MSQDRKVNVLKCLCKNKFQDGRYGKAMRVHCPCKVKGIDGWRCTVCLGEKT